jgi:hypothetical protein
MGQPGGKCGIQFQGLARRPENEIVAAMHFMKDQTRCGFASGHLLSGSASGFMSESPRCLGGSGRGFDRRVRDRSGRSQQDAAQRSWQ